MISSSEPVPELESELELTKIGVGMLGVEVVLLAIGVVVPKSGTLGVPKDRTREESVESIDGRKDSFNGIEQKGMGVGGEGS